MRKYGLIGNPLAHSFSQKYFTEKFQGLQRTDCMYGNYEIASLSLLPEIIREEPGLLGLNVTIPYKQRVLALMDSTDPVAEATGVVNAIKIIRRDSHSRLLGFNTDVFGFEKAILPLLKSRHRKALILGTGASAKSVAFVFKKRGMEYRFVSRSTSDKQFTYPELNAQILSEYLVLVNTSPVGMFPDTGRFPDIPYQYLTSEHLLFDLVYNPTLSLFLEKGREHGAAVQNGLSMLHFQADKSWEIWNDNDLG